MAKIKIKYALSEDVPLILKLIRELAEFENLVDQVVATEDLLREKLFGDKAYAEVIISYLDGQAIGFALFFHNFSTFVGKQGIYLEDLYVSPGSRRLGAAKCMLSFIAKLCVERDCGRFEWSSLDWNRHAIDFYKGIGAVAMDQWTGYRLTGENLIKLSQTPVEIEPC